MDLINRDRLYEDLDGTMAVSPTGYIHGDTVADMIGDQPAVDAIPIEWMEQKYPPAVNHDSVRYISKVDLLNEIIDEWRREE